SYSYISPFESQMDYLRERHDRLLSHAIRPLQQSGHSNNGKLRRPLCDSFITMKRMNRAGARGVINLAILSFLTLVMSVEVCGQGVDVEKAVMDRARIYEPAIIKAATRHGVDAQLLWVIAYLETRFNPALVSRKGARGMMQFMPATAERF